MADLEKAKREMRPAKSAADDRRWDQLESRIQTIEDALKGVPDADAAPVLAELKPLKDKLAAGVREEKAGRIERDVKRSLSAAADELKSGYTESPNLAKAIARLASAEAREVLTAHSVATLQAEIATLQGKPAAAPPPPPPKPAAPAPSVITEEGRRIEGDVARTLKFGADELPRNPSGAETYVAKATAKLDSADAQKNLPAGTMQTLRTQLAELKAKVDAALRQEKAGEMEREIKRGLSAAADELGRGYAESPQLMRALTRLNSAEAREVLTPEMVAKLEAEAAPLRAKSTVKPPPPPPPKPAPAAVPSPAPASKPAAPAPAVSEQARLFEGDVTRTLRFAADEITRNPLACESQISRVEAKLESDEARQHLPPETLEGLRAQVADLRAKFEAAQREEKARTLEDFIGRFLRNAESDLGYNRRQAEGHLERASERIEKDDVKELLSAETVARFRTGIARVQGLVAAAAKKDALDRAHPILRELEERTARPIFDGSQQEWQILGGLDALKSRVRGALSEVPQDDADVKAIEKRIAAVDDTIATATVKLGREQACTRLTQIWGLEKEALAGWEEESGGDAKTPTYEMPRTAVTVRRVSGFLKDTDVQRIASEYKSDKEIQAVIAGARKILESAVAKLQGAFTAFVAAMEKKPRPSNRIELEEPFRLAGSAGSDFEGTPHKDANVKRAKALGDRWQAEIEADLALRKKKYDELSVRAAAAWPRILSKIQAEEEFDPTSPRSEGRTVLIKGLRNRIGWDFSGKYGFAIWVNETPVVGNYDKTVAAAVDEACELAGLPLDEYSDWDAVILVGAPGRIKQRFQVVVRDRNNLELGRIEEWRPVDCVMCTVIALRAGPAAVGPKA